MTKFELSYKDFLSIPLTVFVLLLDFLIPIVNFDLFRMSKHDGFL